MGLSFTVVLSIVYAIALVNSEFVIRRDRLQRHERLAMAIAGAIQAELDEHGDNPNGANADPVKEAHLQALLNDFSGTRVLVWFSGKQGRLLLPSPTTSASTSSAASLAFYQDPKLLQLAGLHAAGMQRPRAFAYAGETYFTCSIPLKGNAGVLRILEDVGISPASQKMNVFILLAIWFALVVLTAGLVQLVLGFVLAPIHRLEDALDTVSLSPAGSVEGLAISAAEQPEELQSIMHAYARLSQRLEVAWSRQSLFIKAISHELLTPITLITASSRRLLRKSSGLSAGEHELLTTVHNESSRISRLVRDLLDLARGDAGSLIIENVAFDAAQVIRGLVDDVALLEWGHRVIFQSDLMLKLPQELIAMGDAERVRQCVLNLMENAAKYSGDSAPVIVSLEATQNEILITVKDFGAGIPKHDWEHVFLAFYRSSDTTGESSRSGVSGSGIGLAIVKMMTEQMGGSVSVVESDATGTCIEMRLLRQVVAVNTFSLAPVS
jgi:hypothetical protein